MWPLTWIVIAGTLPGVFIGALVRVAWLPDPRHFKLFAACVLLYIGAKMIRELLGKKSGQSGTEDSEKRFQEMVRPQREQKRDRASTAQEKELSAVRVTHFNLT